MADKKISELPASSALDTDDLVAVVEDGTTVKATIQDLLDLAGTGTGLPEGYSIPDYIQASGSDQTTTMDAALGALPSDGGVVLIPAGTFYSKIKLFNGPGGVTVRGAGMGVTTIVKPDTDACIQTLNIAPDSTFEDMTFDLSAGGTGAMVLGLQDGNVTFRRCHFTNVTSYAVGCLSSVNTTFEDCEFDDDATATASAVTCSDGVRGLKWIRSKARFMGNGILFDATPHDEIDVDGGLFDGGWYLLPTRGAGYTNSGGTVTYTATVLTDSAAAFATLPTPFDVNVRALPVLESGLTGTTYKSYVNDAAATFVTNVVKPGYIVRTSTKWAVVARVSSETLLYVEEWFDSTTYRPTDPPATSTAYTVHRVLIGTVASNTATAITVERWYDFYDGATVLPASGTLYEVLINHGEYSGIHAAAASPGATGGIRRIRVHGGCRITRSWNDQLSIYGTDARLVVEPSVLIDHGQDYGITSHGDQARIQGTVVHNGAVGIYTTGDDCRIDAFASGSPYINPTDGYLGDILISGHRTRATGSVVVASGAWARYGFVVAGPAVDTNPVDAVDLTGTSASGYSVGEYRLYSLGTPTVEVTNTVLRDVTGVISEVATSGTVTTIEPLPPMVTGLYYRVGTAAGASTNVGMALNMLQLYRLTRPGGKGIDRLGLEIVVGAAATGVLRFGFYTETAGRPDALIADLGTVASTSTGLAAATASLAAGTSPVWCGVVGQTTVTSLSVRALGAGGGWGSTDGLSAAASHGGLYVSGVSGALPGTVTPSSDWFTHPAMVVRAS